jgi:CHAT domain-containing protein
LQESQEEARRGYEKFKDVAEWSGQFRILEARAALWRGLFEETLRLLDGWQASPSQPSLKISTLTVIGIAKIRLHRFPRAEQDLREAENLCRDSSDSNCGEVLQARGLLANEQNQFESARQFYGQSLSFAHSRADRFLEATSLLNLGAMSLAEGHFDEAIDQSQAGYDAAKAVDAKIVELVTRGNLGWAYYRLGDSEKAMSMFVDAERTAGELGDVSDQENQLTNIGYIEMDQRKPDQAKRSFEKALELSKKIDAKEDIYNALRALARLSLQTKDAQAASNYAAQALALASDGGNQLDALYPTLVQGQAAAIAGDVAKATEVFQRVEQSKVAPVFLRWEAQHSLARLHEETQDSAAADRQYRAALRTFEAARDAVRHQDYQLSFLTNGWRIYDDYVHFLIAEGKSEEALRWADFSRARTLASGLGLLQRNISEPPALNAKDIARREKETIFFYWLGEKQSYLWAVTARKVSLFTLPPGADIEALVQRYRQAVSGPSDVLASMNRDGTELYKILIAPAKDIIGVDAHALLIPDGALNNLNFEMLLVPEPKLHYWIEDATIASASSLRVLSGNHSPAPDRSRRLLLIGDSIAPSKDYPELPKASTQMAAVAKHFDSAKRSVLQRANATPPAYLDGSPGKFSYIHFVAHGTASRLSPLDSAIILSRGMGEGDFKLYARDILQHPLRAELVTISSCYGAGERNYSGEGLVGLSWAFLRAGAHNVIAALWEATDASTEELMDRVL